MCDVMKEHEEQKKIKKLFIIKSRRSSLSSSDAPKHPDHEEPHRAEELEP